MRFMKRKLQKSQSQPKSLSKQKPRKMQSWVPEATWAQSSGFRFLSQKNGAQNDPVRWWGTEHKFGQDVDNSNGRSPKKVYTQEK